jgi:signal transduction histidine kinase
VAHTLAVTMLHLSAARLAVQRAPERAAEALAEAEHQGRNGLADLRRVVRLLREDGDAATGPLALAPPDLAALPTLVAGYRRAGLPVCLAVEGDLGAGASPAVGATLYRLAQESLANAAKHGTGPAEARLVLDGGGAALTVRNTCAPVAGAAAVAHGSGLAGMAERVAGLGGTFRAGPAEPGTWEVAAVLPGAPEPLGGAASLGGAAPAPVPGLRGPA